MTRKRLTPIQQGVVDAMNAGAELREWYFEFTKTSTWFLVAKNGIHTNVSRATANSLRRRRIIYLNQIQNSGTFAYALDYHYQTGKDIG